MKKIPDISPTFLYKKFPDISRTFNFPDISLTPGHPGFGDNCDNGMIWWMNDADTSGTI